MGKVFVVFGFAVTTALLAFYLYATSESTLCFANFDSHAEAESAAAAASEIGFDADIEESGPDQRRSTSPGGRRIGVTFSTGATGDDAAGLRQGLSQIVKQERGHGGHPGDDCLEKPPFD